MNIEIAEPGRMTQSGSSLLRLIQNNDMPLLDLLVRESVQNSLDAHKPDSKYVNVAFSTGLFNSLEFVEHLDGITATMKARYPEKMQHFLAIRDSETVGLTGPLHYDDVTGSYGNLLKLVYEISKPQENAGAGGSWGLGKTVYFRIGIGMVLYYSRIKEQGHYSSRLAVSMVEDENSNDSIIPAYENKAKRGIAWWGEKIGKNKTHPVQDETVIARILKIFHIQPFAGNETGTLIIIPYIDQQKLLDSNCREHETLSEKSIKPYWQNKLEHYLEVAFQRWYAPRLDNSSYKYGPFLRAYVNEKEVLCTDTPLFYLAQKLYNYALSGESDGKYNWHGLEITLRTISLRGVLEKSAAGHVAFCKVSSAWLKETPPDNKYNPYVFANCDRQNPNVNPPVMMYCRKPGMVVSYETNGSWTEGITPTTQGEYIVGFFTIDSEVAFKETVNGEKLTLEEYIRKSELADHTSWSDYTLLGCKTPNPRIVNKVRAQITKSIAKAFEDTPVIAEKSVNVGWGKLFGDLLLPPVNFGKLPSIPAGPGGGGEVVAKERGAMLRINRNKVTFNTDGTVEFPFRLDVDNHYGMNCCQICAEVAAENNTMSASDWEDFTNTPLPFAIVSAKVTEIGQGKHMKNSQLNFHSESMEVEAAALKKIITLTKQTTGKEQWYGLNVVSDTDDAYSIKGTISVSSKDKSVKTGFKLGIVKQTAER